jgi:hypothetical protein
MLLLLSGGSSGKICRAGALAGCGAEESGVESHGEMNIVVFVGGEFGLCGWIDVCVYRKTAQKPEN